MASIFCPFSYTVKFIPNGPDRENLQIKKNKNAPLLPSEMEPPLHFPPRK